MNNEDKLQRENKRLSLQLDEYKQLNQGLENSLITQTERRKINDANDIQNKNEYEQKLRSLQNQVDSLDYNYNSHRNKLEDMIRALNEASMDNNNITREFEE